MVKMQPRRPQARAMPHEQKRAFYTPTSSEGLPSAEFRPAENTRKSVVSPKQFLAAVVEFW
jgi:hypothetical protein